MSGVNEKIEQISLAIQELEKSIETHLDQTSAIIIKRITDDIDKNHEELLLQIKQTMEELSNARNKKISFNSSNGYNGLKWPPPVTRSIGEIPKLKFKSQLENFSDK